MMDVQIVRHALRSVVRAPRFSLAVGGILALGVGCVGAMLLLVNALVWRSLPVPAAERLVAVFPANGEALFGIPEATLAELRQRQTVFDDLCGFTLGGQVQVEVGGTITRHVNESVSGSCFRLLGVKPYAGRLIDESDAPLPGEGSPVAVVSLAFFRQILGGSPDAIGRAIRIQGQQLTVIGVLPEGVGFDADQSPDVVVPLGVQSKLTGIATRRAFYAVGALRRDRTLASVDAEMRALWPSIWTATNVPAAGQPPSSAAKAESLRVESIARGISVLRGRYQEVLLFLLSLAALLTVLTAINVGGLTLARTMARDHELRVRMSIGATEPRLLLELLTENTALSGAAALASIPVAWAASHVLVAAMWTGSTPQTIRMTPDFSAYAAIAATALLAGICVSLPAMAFIRRRLASAGLHTSRRASAASTYWRRTIVLAQVALSLTLLFVAGAFARNLAGIRAIDRGYASDGLMWSRLELPLGQSRTIDQAAYFRPLLDRLRTQPGVRAATLAIAFPTTETRHVVGLQPFSRVNAQPGFSDVSGRVDRISTDFFSTVGVPLLHGREFAWTDTTGQTPVAVVNRTLAMKLFQRENVLGESVRLNPTNQTFTIVGVVADASPGDPRIIGLPTVYRPLLQEPTLLNGPILIVRSSEAGTDATALRALVEDAGRHKVPAFRTIDEQMDRFLVRERLMSGIALAFSGLSLAITATGLFATMAYAAVRRTRELGIRMALGASRLHVFRLLIAEGALLLLAGTLVGVPLAYGVSRLTRTLVFQAPGFDGLALWLAVTTLSIASAVACAWPALRATRLTLTEALRAD